MPRFCESHLEAAAVKANELLFWLSARVQGSWEQFKSAVEELHLPEDLLNSRSGDDESNWIGFPMHQSLRFMLSRLGHVEFFANGCERGWRVTPPSWTLLLTDKPRAILCGARTPQLLRRVETAISEPASLAIGQAADIPASYCIDAPSRERLVEAVSKSGIPLLENVPLLILNALPPLSDWGEDVDDLPVGQEWIVEKFGADRQRWETSSRDVAIGSNEGLFRFRLPYQSRYFIRRRGMSREVEGAAAKYVLLRRYGRRVLHFSADSKSLRVPASCRPPLLVERALILCSGRLPTFDAESSILEYGAINSEVARAVAGLMQQDLHQ